MEGVAPLVIVYLLGAITPVMFLRYFLGQLGQTTDGEGCLLDLFLLGVIVFIAFFLFVWVKIYFRAVL